MADKQFDFNGKARLKLLRGATQLTDAVKVTLGPRGRHVVLDRAANAPITTKDGVSVAREIELENPVENMGAQVIKEIAAKTEQSVGDGTTTATVIAHKILKESVRMVAIGWNPMEIKKGIDLATASVIERLRALSRPCRTRQMIAHVATFAANGDSELGNLIADALDRRHPDTSITVEQGPGTTSAVRSAEGLHIDSGYLSSHFITDANSTTVELENPVILIYGEPLSSTYQLASPLERIAQLNRPLLIIAQSVEGEALDALVINHIRGVLQSVAVKVPGVGDQRRALLQDIAALTGATVISSETGLDLEAVETSHLGRVDKANITRETTVLVKESGQNPALDEHLSHIRHRLSNATSESEKELLNWRLSNLTGGLTVIEVGGTTEQELQEKKSRLTDALSAARAAIDEGVVPGGGAALLACRDAATSLRHPNEAQAAGAQILARALEEPIRQIAANAGLEPSVVVDDVVKAGPNHGLDANSGKCINLLEKGIVDPVKVVRNALQNAASAAGLLVTAECVITDAPATPRPSEEEHA